MQEKEEEKAVSEIQGLVTDMSAALEKYEKLSTINFGLFFKDGRISFLNLEALQKSIDEHEEKEQVTE